MYPHIYIHFSLLPEELLKCAWRIAGCRFSPSQQHTTRKISESDQPTTRGGGLGSRPKKMHGERSGDGVEYHLMSPTPRC